MPTPAQLEEQIYACEGFRVRLTPLKPNEKKLPSYDFLVMAPQKWRISDWKIVRLRAFIPFVREVVVLRGDEKPAKTDIQLGALRDSYYQAKYRSLAATEVEPTAVAELAKKTPSPN
jgi:hypothetical protein